MGLLKIKHDYNGSGHVNAVILSSPLLIRWALQAFILCVPFVSHRKRRRAKAVPALVSRRHGLSLTNKLTSLNTAWTWRSSRLDRRHFFKFQSQGFSPGPERPQSPRRGDLTSLNTVFPYTPSGLLDFPSKGKCCWHVYTHEVPHVWSGLFCSIVTCNPFHNIVLWSRNLVAPVFLDTQ